MVNRLMEAADRAEKAQNEAIERYKEELETERKHTHACITMMLGAIVEDDYEFRNEEYKSLFYELCDLAGIPIRDETIELMRFRNRCKAAAQ